MSIEIRKFESRRRGRVFRPSNEALEFVSSLPDTDKENRARMTFTTLKEARRFARQVKRLEAGAVCTIRPGVGYVEVWGYNKYL